MKISNKLICSNQHKLNCGCPLYICVGKKHISIYTVNSVRLKKNTLSQSLREFFKPTRHAVFYFFFFTSIGLCLHAQPKPKMTESFNFRIFRIKLSSFFVVKMKKKKLFQGGKKMKVSILQNQMRIEKQMRAAALRHRIFFFSLSTTYTLIPDIPV